MNRALIHTLAWFATIALGGAAHADRATASANPSRTGSSQVGIEYHPPTATHPGKLTVTMPEMYVGGTRGPTTTPKTLYGTKGSHTVEIGGVLRSAAHGHGSYASSHFEGTIPANTTVDRETIASALQGLHVHRHTIKWDQ